MHALGLVDFKTISLDCLHHEKLKIFQGEGEKLPPYQLIPICQSREPMCSLIPLPLSDPLRAHKHPHPHWYCGASLFTCLNADMGRSLFAYLCLFYKVSLFPSSLLLSPSHSLLLKASWSFSAGLLCTIPRQVHVVTEIVFHPHQRGDVGLHGTPSLTLEI